MRTFSIVVLLALAACGSSSSSGGGGGGGSSGGGSATGGGSGGGSGGGTGGNGDSNPDIYKNAATGSLSGEVTGSFAMSFVEIGSRSSPPPPVFVSVLAYDDNDMTAGITVTAPSGATVLQVINTLGFSSAPATGTAYDQTSALLCGGFAIGLSNGKLYQMVMDKGCDGSSKTAQGTVSINLSSMTTIHQNNAGLATFSKASGTLQMHLVPDQGSGSGVDISLTF
ncbi:MAG: hypothetical protein QM723_00205 [Myxococcaceae bacterium]